jgi:hypothetical protein
VSAREQHPARLLRGKVVKGVRLNGRLCRPKDECGHGVVDDVEIVFTDGSIARFFTQETCDCDYGVTIIYPAKPASGRA